MAELYGIATELFNQPVRRNLDRFPEDFHVPADKGGACRSKVTNCDLRKGTGTLFGAQWRWPVGMPLCRPLGEGLWEVRTDLPTKRTARVLLCLYRGHLVALHGFIKKTRAAPDEDLAMARKRQKE